MSRYSPRRQDVSSRTYHEPTTGTNRQYPLSSRSFGTADNSPGRTYKRNSPLTERGSPVSRASSFSAGRLSSSRKTDTAETSGESPSKFSKASCIPQASNSNRDGTSSLHARLSSRAHQDTTSGKIQSSSSSDHKQSRLTNDPNLSSPRRKVTEDSAAKRDSSHIGQRSLGRGTSESPSKSSQDSDGGSPSNIPLRASYMRGLEGDKNSDLGGSRLLRSSGRLKTTSGRVGISSSESVDDASTRTPKDSKLYTQKSLSSDSEITTTTTTNAPSFLPNKNEKFLKDKTSPDGFKEPSPTTDSPQERSNLTINLKKGNKGEGVAKAPSPPKTMDVISPKQAFDRSSIKYNSCRSRIPTPNSPSGSRKGSESPVRQKLSSHSFSGSRTTESGNANDETGSSKNVESRADRIARYKDLRRRELASKIKSKLDPETEPEAVSRKNMDTDKSNIVKEAEVGSASSTAVKTSATRSATADSTKIICGMKVSKNIAERAKKRQERMLRNSQHLSAELIGRNAKISAVCSRVETPESGDCQVTISDAKINSSKLDMEFGTSQNNSLLQPSPLQDRESLSPSSLSLSDNDKDSTYQQLTSESSDISPEDKRLSLTELESLSEITSSDELNLNIHEEVAISAKKLRLQKLSPPLEDISHKTEPVKNQELPPEKTILKMKQESINFSKTAPQEVKPTAVEKKSLNPPFDQQNKSPVTSPYNISSSLDKRVEKIKSPLASSVHYSGISNDIPGSNESHTTNVEVGSCDLLSKSSIKFSQAKDVSSSYASSDTKSAFQMSKPKDKQVDVVPEKQVEIQFPMPSEKVRTRPPPSTVLYTKKLLESGNVKKDQKRIDYDLQKELDWLEHRKYQYPDESDVQKEKKLSVLEMVKAAESKTDSEEEKPRRPLGRTMSEARGKDAAQSRKEILATRISSLGRTRSFGMGPIKKPDISTSLDQQKTVLSPIKDNHLDELLMKNVAYLDDENLPKDPLVRSLHPGENLKLRKSLRKKKVAKLSSLPEKGMSEDIRTTLNSKESTVDETSASRATLKLKEPAPASGPLPPITASPAPFIANVSERQGNKKQETADNYITSTVPQSFAKNVAPQELTVSQSVTQPVTQNFTSGVTPKPLHVVQKPARPNLVQSRHSDKQLHVTQPAVTKPVSPNLQPSQTSSVNQKELHVTQPSTRKPISPSVTQSQVSDTAQKQLLVTQPSVTKPVSPTAATGYQVSNVATKELPTLKESVTSAVPVQADVIDAPQRKRVHSQNRGKPVAENVTDPAQVTSVPKKRKDKSGSHKDQLGSVEENLDPKVKEDSNQELSPSGLTSTEKSTTHLTFENSNASASINPAAPESTTQPRRSRQRVRPDDIPAPILDVIKASLDYEHNGTQSKAEPCRATSITQSKPPASISASNKTLLEKPLTEGKSSPGDEPLQAYSPVVSRRFSDVNKSTITTVNHSRMSEDIGASIAEPVHPQSLSSKTDRSDSVTVTPSSSLGSNVQKASLTENNNSSKIAFHAADLKSGGNVTKNLDATKELRPSLLPEVGITKDVKKEEQTFSKTPRVADGTQGKESMPTKSEKLGRDSSRVILKSDQPVEDQDISRVPIKDFADVELFIREDNELEKDKEEPVKIPESNFRSTSKLSLTSKATEPVSSQMRKPASITDDRQPQGTISSSAVEKPEISSAQVTSTVSHTPVTRTAVNTTKSKTSNSTTATKTLTSVTETKKDSVTSSAPVTSTGARVTPAVTTSVNVAPEIKRPSVTSAEIKTSARNDTVTPSEASVTIPTSQPVTTSVTSLTPKAKSAITVISDSHKTNVTSSSPVIVTAPPCVISSKNVVTDVKKPAVSLPSVSHVTSVTSNTPVTATAPPSVTSVPQTSVTSVTSSQNVVTDVKKPAASLPSVSRVTSVTSSTLVTTAAPPSVTSVPQASVTNATSSKNLSTDIKKPAVNIPSDSHVTSSKPVTTTTDVTPAAATLTSPTSTNLTKAPSVTLAACVTSTTRSTPVTTVSESSTMIIKTSPEVTKPVSVTSSLSVTKPEPVISTISNVTTSTALSSPATQTTSVTSTNSAMAPRSFSLSPPLPESHDLTRSLELTQKDIENGNLMTRSAQFTQPRMSEGSLNIPRRGILKRSGSLRSNNINSELIDPELAVVFQARRIKEQSEQPTSDLAEEDSVFDDKFQCTNSLLSEIIDEESEEKPLSVAERISQMETKISVSTSGCTTPKTPRSRLGSVPRMPPENENKKCILPQEELFNKLTDLARSKEATQERQKRYQRSRDDWRIRTQPVTLKEVEQADRQTLADKVKLFSNEKELNNEKSNRADAPVIRRRNRRFASRFNTQPITSEEMENVFRISPLAISLVKPPDPEILKGLPLNAQRELSAQYAEACLSQQGSRAGSRASSRPGSQAGSRRGSIEESEESKAETKGILKMADYQKDLQQVKSILKTESGRDSPEREIRSILKNDGERRDSEPSRSILKQDSNEQAKIESETRSILKSSEPEHRRSSKQLDLEPRGILKVTEPDVYSTPPKTSEPKSVLKKDSSWDKNGSEPRGILKKESSFDFKKEPEKGVLKRLDSKESKEVSNQDSLRGILKKESSTENLDSQDEEISQVLSRDEEQKTPIVPEGKRKEYRRGSDERYLTQPVTDMEKKSPESGRKIQRYGSRHHKTQPVTPEEKKEATQVIQPIIKMSDSLAERLQALQKSGEEDWKKRLTKPGNSASPSPDREVRSCSPDSTPLRPANLLERMSLLKSSQSSWRSRVEESDAKAFTVEGKLSISGQSIRERSVVTKLKQTVKTTETDQSNSATSPSTPTKGDWKIPIPKEIIVSETTFEETVENSNNIVKLPELNDDGLDQFFGSSSNLFDKNELLDISVDDFDEIFQTSKNILIHSVKSRPKKKVQARSKNPLKSRSSNLERQEYEEFKTNVAEMELKRIKKEALSRDAGFAEAALAGLASKENFSKIELRKTDTSVPSPGGHRYLPYKPLMLLHVKGRRHVQTRLVEPCARNVNQGDCYVLITPDKVINWIGEYSNIIEKAKSADVAAHIQQKKDMGYKSSSGIITIDSKKNCSSVFWSLLEGHESECQECGGLEEDEIYENAIINTNMIYQIEKNRLIPFEEYWGGLPKYEMLKSHQVFVFDFGAEVYVWQGKKAVPQKRKIGLELAQQLWDKGYNYELSTINPLSPLQGGIEDTLKCSSGQRPSWTLIAKVNENMETVLFREKFADWPDSARLIKVKTVDSNSNKTENGDLIPYDAQKLIEKEPPEALLLTLDGSQVGRGTYWSEDMGGFIQEFEINTLAVTVWHILEFDHYKLEPLSNGQFHEGDTYVVRWEYRIVATGAKPGMRRPTVGRERCAYFFWQGQTSTITEKGASALMTVELDEERGPQVRVLQGKEPPCFMNLFKGQMVVHIGKREEEETNTQGHWRFYSVRHEKRNEMCLIEIQAQISSLRSRSSFILLNVQTGKVFIWHGAKSPQYTRTLALEAVNSIQERHPLEIGLPENINVNITEMNEGCEKPEFWMALRSRDRKQYMSLLNDPRSYNFSLRLFQFTSVSGVIDVTEIRNPTIASDVIAPYPFLQSDLYKVSQPALFLLDNGYEVYLWQGWWPEGDEEIENVLTGSAPARFMVERHCAMQTAVDYCQAKNLSTTIKPYLVYAGLEPLKFINIFPFWSIDETVKELSLKDGKYEGDLVSVEDELNRLSLVRYTFKELLERPLPEDVDPLKLESYLSDEEFMDVLKMTKPDYYSLPAWKQSKLKQDIGLF